MKKIKSSKSGINVEINEPKLIGIAADATVIGLPVSIPEPKKRGRKSNPASVEKMYFTSETEDAIEQYNKEESQEIRNHIYNLKIKHSFEKLVENIFNKFKFTYFDVGPLDVQREAISHLVANMSKYDKTKGKAYSYFSIVAKHYFIFHNNSNYKRFNQHVDITEAPSESSVCLQSEDAHYKNVEMNEFMAMTVKYWEDNINKVFSKGKDLAIANAVLEILKRSGTIDTFNKKAIYLYIREISNCKTQQITKVINRMRDYQRQITKQYLNSGVI